MSKNKKTEAIEAYFPQGGNTFEGEANPANQQPYAETFAQLEELGNGEHIPEREEQQPVVEEQDAPQEPLQPYDKVKLTFEDGRTEVCFWVGDGTYSRANSQGKAFKVGQPREGVVSIEKLLQ